MKTGTFNGMIKMNLKKGEVSWSLNKEDTNGGTMNVTLKTVDDCLIALNNWVSKHDNMEQWLQVRPSFIAFVTAWIAALNRLKPVS